MGLFSFSFFTQRQPFEKELLQLELRITQHQNTLATIHARLHSTLHTVCLYATALWITYAALWYYSSAPQPLLALPVLLVPLLILSFRWIFRTYYRRKEEAEQIQLRLLQKQLRDKVEEVKKKTAYYSTKELLERYDDQTQQQNSHLTPNQPGRTRAGPSTDQAILRERNRVSSTSSHHPTDDSPNGSPFSPAQNHPLPVGAPSPTSQPRRNDPPPPPPPASSSSTTRGWADRVAEALLGNDDEAKYALICKSCLAHNGLVRREELDLIKYVCPRCGVLNASTRNLEGNREGGDEKGLGGTSQAGKYQQSGLNLGAGRKSLGGPVTRTKPTNDSFHVVEKKRVTSPSSASLSTPNSTDDLSTLDLSDLPLEPCPTEDHTDQNHPSLVHSEIENTSSPSPDTPSQPSSSRSQS